MTTSTSTSTAGAPRIALDHASVRAMFPGSERVIYLNTATMALGSAPVRAAYEQALEAWQEGRFDFTAAERAGEECRRLFAGLVGARPEEVAIVPAVSAAAGLVAAQLGPARTGENVLVGEQEFSSNFYPWMMLRERGYEIRAVPFTDGAPRVEAFASRVDSRTRLVAVSAVQSSSGRAADLAALAELAHRSGAWLFVDACQAAGAVPLDLHGAQIDFLACASHKFLCGTRGMGYLAVNMDRVGDLRPVGPGWRAAREPLQSFYGPRMELSPTASRLDGSLTWFAALGDRAALDLIDRIGAPTIFERNARLVAHLRAALRERGLPVADEPHPSTIVSLPIADTDRVLARFGEAKVIAAVRAGRVRIAVHFYNHREEMDLVAGLLTS